jgi:hypothetical protein
MHYMLPAPYCHLYLLPPEQRQHPDRNLPLSLNRLQGITLQKTESFVITRTRIFVPERWKRGETPVACSDLTED